MKAVVAGAVTPDTYVLGRDLQVTAYEIADKDVMVARRGVGTREVPVDEERRKATSLSHAQVRVLGRLALELEAATGFPVDLECAFRGGDVFLLQCRPVTTFGPSGGPS